MKFKMKVCVVGNEAGAWFEEYEKEVTDAQAWAEQTIQRFNETLRPKERPRKLLGVEVLNVTGVKEHTWQKVNIMTLTGPKGCYDLMQCKRCGITAKRYGLGNLIFDSQYRAKRFLRCDTSLDYLTKQPEARFTQAERKRGQS